jgi:hypothetical protein
MSNIKKIQRITTITHKKPLVLIPLGSYIPLVGVTKTETDALTNEITFYLGERTYKSKCLGGTILGTYENGKIIYK